ncbi:hypothetical protein [Burkholderia sp. WP9]|uniref:hypothetical protein n=1 Tax=Burkholderia sp. WP9 TaxID=1500263 RepID=UPI00115FE2DF|nr:hypothetical protein [Burkholderia sp. WP9]
MNQLLCFSLSKCCFQITYLNALALPEINEEKKTSTVMDAASHASKLKPCAPIPSNAAVVFGQNIQSMFEIVLR